MKLRLFAIFFSVFILASPALAQQGSMSVTVTPTLFQLSIGPNESWSSSVKVVNNNNYDATYYVQVLDFTASGEEGQSKYIPLIGDAATSPQTYSLASWMTVPKVPLTIKAGQSQDVPFSVHVPENAEPGGHYAAILIGTKPQGSLQTSGAQISSFVSSLLFVRIRGEAIETGRIREFSTQQSVYQEPKSDFLLRFENTGNTHLHPEGDVVIYNMWGKERGRVAINQDENFGNVLPNSVRRFQFSWEAESSPFDIGPYSAVVTLAYGEDGRKNITAKTYFWVIPTGPLLATLASVLAFVAILVWFIRRYIRKALDLEKARFDVVPKEQIAHGPIRTLLEPLKEGVIDLRAATNSIEQRPAAPVARHENSAQIKNVKTANLRQFISKYRLFFAFVALVLVATLISWWYLERALEQHREYKIKAISSEVEEVTQGATSAR